MSLTGKIPIDKVSKKSNMDQTPKQQKISGLKEKEQELIGLIYGLYDIERVKRLQQELWETRDEIKKVMSQE